ncbi:MAG: tetratricopeptide repeat protein [Raineya sp.]|jgi:tetratricopeptide (TPR) repeat protein|nr:tetratricopeptide repeat protein [Raineya sp.]
MKKTWIVALMLIQLPLFAQKNYKEAQNMALSKIQEKSYTDAIPLLDKAIQFKPKIAENYYLKGYCLAEQSKNEEAIKNLDQAIKLDAKQWRYFKKRGDAYYNSKLYDKSVPDYTKAIDLEISKKNDTLFQYRADAYIQVSKYQEAIEDYNKAIVLNNQNKILYYYRGFTYAKLGNKEKSCLDYLKAYEMGFGRAQIEAFELMQCDWAKPKVKEKDTRPVAISDVQVDPFTGAVFILKGLTYEKYEITPKEGGFVTSSIFGYDESFVLKLDKPRGFNLNNTEAHVGVWF